MVDRPGRSDLRFPGTSDAVLRRVGVLTGVQTAMFALSVPLAFAAGAAVVVLWVAVYAGLAAWWALRRPAGRTR